MERKFLGVPPGRYYERPETRDQLDRAGRCVPAAVDHEPADGHRPWASGHPRCELPALGELAARLRVPG